MQRKTFLFFAKLTRYVTCLRYSVSKGQREPGSALWPCHFKNKNTSASTTAEVKMIIKVKKKKKKVFLQTEGMTMIRI